MYTTILAIVLIALLWAAGTFFGVIGGLPKAFKKAPPSSINGKATQQAQQDFVDATKEKQQQYMDDVKQRIKDSSMKKY